MPSPPPSAPGSAQRRGTLLATARHGSGGSAVGSTPGSGAAGAAVSAQAARSGRAVRRAAGEVPVATLAARIVRAVEAGAAAGLRPNPVPALLEALATLRRRLALRRG